MQRISKELLSRTECLNILKNFRNTKEEVVNLVDYQLRRDETAVGFAGDYYELTLNYCSAAAKAPLTQSFFVKALPQLSNDLQMAAIFRKERCLYDSLLDELQKYSKTKWIPNCYYTRHNLIVLENLKLCGYCGIKETLLTEEQLQQLLRTVAALHAASLICEQLREINIGCEFGHCLQEFIVGPSLRWFTTGLLTIQAVLRSLPHYQTPRHLRFIDAKLIGIMERVYEQVASSTKHRNCLCHRDLWVGNMFFTTIPQDAAILVDYQACRYTPPAIDLCFVLYMNLTQIERRRLEMKCIDFYYSCLKRELEEFGLQATDLVPKTELLQSYKEFRLFGVIYSTVAATTTKVPPSFVTDEFKFVDRSRVILDYMQKNAKFRKAMEDYCVEVMEIVMAIE